MKHAFFPTPSLVKMEGMMNSSKTKKKQSTLAQNLDVPVTKQNKIKGQEKPAPTFVNKLALQRKHAD